MRIKKNLGKSRVWLGLHRWWWDRSCWRAPENTINRPKVDIKEVWVQARHRTGAYLTRDILITHIKEQQGSKRKGPSQPLIIRDTIRQMLLRSANMTHYQYRALANQQVVGVPSSIGRERARKDQIKIVQDPISISNSNYKTDQPVKLWVERLNSATPNHSN